MIIEIGI